MQRKTKIIATLGPASGSRETIGRMVGAGMDVARLNFSHGTYDTHRQWAGWVREAAAEHGRAVAILQDIQGPRIRVGTFPGGSVDLTAGERVSLADGNGQGDEHLVYVQHLAAADLSPGDRVLLADGLISLQVVEREGDRVSAVVREGGSLGDHKGAAFPGVHLGLPAITEKDREDLQFGQEIGVDIVAASFVESGSDITAVREIVGETPVVAKIERVAAYANLADILSLADGAMVARGDLGVELGFEPLPRAQKEIILAANGEGRITITATEMLESMTSSPRPTRAEVTDVANAILDGTDAVMLSAETAVGKYPVRTIEVMAAICCEAESSPTYPAGGHVDFVGPDSSFASAIAQATADTANALDLATVVAFTESGSTAQLVSKYRPRARIVGFTPNEATYRRMAIMWGVTPVMFPRLDSTDAMIFTAEATLLEMGVVEDREPIAMAAGIPPNIKASTNLLKLHVVGDGAVGMPR
ncbi:MAG: pyruvate kinase [Acidimicrobiia bacterium]|nr:pyruvate kinase [Acidimicrobiia bacterium]